MSLNRRPPNTLIGVASGNKGPIRHVSRQPTCFLVLERLLADFAGILVVVCSGEEFLPPPRHLQLVMPDAPPLVQSVLVSDRVRRGSTNCYQSFRFLPGADFGTCFPLDRSTLPFGFLGLPFGHPPLKCFLALLAFEKCSGPCNSRVRLPPFLPIRLAAWEMGEGCLRFMGLLSIVSQYTAFD